MSVRLKLAVSYVGFLMVAWVAFLLVMAYVLRFVPEANLTVVGDDSFAPGRSDLVEVALPVALWGTAALALVGLAGGWLLAGRMLRPLAAIGAVTDRVARGSLSDRVDLPGPADELRRLADDFDHMMDRLESAFAEQRRFTGNASHELQTPHAVVRTMLEVARVDPGRDVDLLIDRLSELNDRSIRSLEALLRLARADQVAPRLEPCDLAVVLGDGIDAITSPARARGTEIHCLLDAAPVTADPLLLRHLADNLLANAVSHNVASGGRIDVSSGTDGRGRAWLEIANTGEPIDPALVDRLVEPFVRGSGRVRAVSGPTGSGLGLSIVASVVRTHDARLSLRARDGGGLVATVVFAP